jgi:hypothetical protein
MGHGDVAGGDRIPQAFGLADDQSLNLVVSGHVFRTEAGTAARRIDEGDVGVERVGDFDDADDHDEKER